MGKTFFAIVGAALFTSGTALADGGCPANTVEVSGVCLPQGCTVRAPGATAGGGAAIVAGLVAAGFLARRRR
jgi:type 1 fimbria pilin